MSRSQIARRRLLEFWNRDRQYYELAIESNPVAAPERRHLFRFLTPGQQVLDVGCGSCENALWLPGECRLVGVDVSMIGLVMARERRRPGVRIRADGIRLPFADGTFDAVLSTWALEHFHDPGTILAQMIRVLKVGGHLLLVGSAWDLPYMMPPSLPAQRRLEVTSKRLSHQLLSMIDGRHRFDIVREPRALTDAYAPDTDAVHVVQSRLLCSYIEDAGARILEVRGLARSIQPPKARRMLRRVLGTIPLWRSGWGDLLIVASRVSERPTPDFELLYL